MQIFKNHKMSDVITTHQQGLLLVVLATLMFSAKGIFIKLVYTYDVEPGMFMFVRMLIAMPFYLWVLLIQKRKGNFKVLNSRLLFFTLLFGISGYYVASYLDLTGLIYLSASLERLVLYSYPSIVLLLSVFFLKQKLTGILVLSLVLVYCGLLVVFIQDFEVTSSGRSGQLFGAGLVFFSAIAFAIYFVGSEIMMRKIPSKLFTSLAMMAASIVIICHYVIGFELGSVLELSPMVYFYGFVVAIFCTVLPSFFLSSGIIRVGAAAGSVVGGVGPVVTLLMAFIFLGESISMLQACGFALVIVGVWNLGRLKST